MKLKTTKKEINQNYGYIIRAGYCELQNLLREPNARAFGYACGVYGWNWDAFEINDASGLSSVCVCTGYRDMTGERIEGIQKFENKCKKLWSWEDKTPYEKKIKKHKKILQNFADYCIKELEKKRATK